MLAQLRERLDHDPVTEQGVARHELAEIVRIRLVKAFR
jgi:2-oxo-4-hydroxy-4-carboxy--5-ureidoimidazoline (OHCU) decarboxylase